MSRGDVMILGRPFKAGSIGSVSAWSRQRRLNPHPSAVANATKQTIVRAYPALKDRAKLNSPLRGEAIREYPSWRV